MGQRVFPSVVMETGWNTGQQYFCGFTVCGLWSPPVRLGSRQKGTGTVTVTLWTRCPRYGDVLTEDL